MTEATGRPQILFVDDEPNVLAGLRRTLWKQRDTWDLHFVAGGAEAVDHLTHRHVDVVVTDMRMPGTDGAAVLEAARRLHPGAARLVLSGHADNDVIIAAAGPTQQFLSKPCEPELLVSAVGAAVATLGLLEDEALRSVIGGQENLPKPPSVYAELTALTRRPETTVADVTHLIERDVATTTEVLKLVNSSFFGLTSDITTIERAVTLLGLEVITALVLAGSLFRPSAALPPDFDAPGLADRGMRACLLTGRVGTREGWDPALVGRLSLAALLEDVGLLVLASHDHAAWSLYRSLDPGTAERSRQLAAFGCTVGRAGAYLLALWGFHDTVVQTVAEQPLDLTDPLSRAGASPAAMTVAYACRTASGAAPLVLDGARDCEYLTAERIRGWGELGD